MNFIIIYGPTAAGKLTVATELKKLTSYKPLDNHTILNAIATVFPFHDPRLNKIRSRIGRRFRLELFEEAAKADVDLITTLIIRKQDSIDFIFEAKEIVERHGGHVRIVQLLPTKEATMERVESVSRKGVKVSSKDHLESFLAENPMQFDSLPGVDHLSIDNTHIQPEDVARQIKEYYQL